MVALVEALAHYRSRPETSRPSWRARSGVTGLRPNERVQRVTACSADLSAPHAQSVMTGENQHHNQALGRSRHRDLSLSALRIGYYPVLQNRPRRDA